MLAIMGDALTDALDKGKPVDTHPPEVVLCSYWDVWQARQKSAQQRGLDPTSESLFDKFVQGAGDRPDVGVGIRRIGEAFGDESSCSGGAMFKEQVGDVPKPPKGL